MAIGVCNECWLRKLEAINLELYSGDGAWNLGMEIATQVVPSEGELPKHCADNIDFMSGYWAGIGRDRQWISEKVTAACHKMWSGTGDC